MTQQPPVGVGILIHDVSRSHSHTPHSVGLLWTSDSARRRDLSLTTHNTHKRQTSIPPGWIRNLNPSNRASSGIG